VLTRIHLLARRPAPIDLLPNGPQTGVELPPAVKRGHDDVPALTALRVIPEVAHDKAPQGVICGVNPGHSLQHGIRTGEDAADQGRLPADSGTEHCLTELATHRDGACEVGTCRRLVIDGSASTGVTVIITTEVGFLHEARAVKILPGLIT